jgi:succinate-semialdehyde dehydrogenase/glutarate-semialdehyde dehydrogenase
VLLKHASNVPQCAEALCRDAGFPNGTYTNLVASSHLASRVIDDDRVQGVSFTGSDDGGAKVAERAGRNAKKTVLELGGSDPFIVLDDADMDLTLERAVFGKMTNMGQSCLAAKRFILHKTMSDGFIDGFRKRLAALKMGDPLDPSTGVAPLSSAQAAAKLDDQVNRSVAAGAPRHSRRQAGQLGRRLLRAHNPDQCEQGNAGLPRRAIRSRRCHHGCPR